MATAPPVDAQAAILGPTSALTRRAEIYEKDAVTRWGGGAYDDRLVDGSITIDYSRPERRAFSLTLENEDFALEHTPEKFWYDKVLKVYSGVKYVDLTPVVTHKMRTNLLFNPNFVQTPNNTTEVRRNLAINPASEGASGWTANNTSIHTVTNDTTTKRSGASSKRSAQASPGTTNAVASFYNIGGTLLPVTVGTTYTASIYWAHNCAQTAYSRIDIQWLQSDGTTVISTSTGANSANITGNAQFSRISVTGTAPTNAVTARLMVYTWVTAGTVGATEYGWYDDCLLEASEFALDYFDGTTTTDGATGWSYAWTGTAHSSASIMKALAFNYNINAYNPGIGGATSAGSLRLFNKTSLASGNIWAFQYDTAIPAVIGAAYAGKMRLRMISGAAPLQVSCRLAHYDSAYVELLTIVGATIPTDGSWVDIDMPSQAVVSSTAYATPTVRAMLYSAQAVSTPYIIEVREIEVEQVSGIGVSAGIFFSGGTQGFSNRSYSWSGTVNASTSVEDTTVTISAAVPKVWERQIGEFVIDTISEDHFPYTVNVAGRDYAKRCLLSKFVNPTTFTAGTAIETVIKAMAQNAGITKFLLPLTGQVLDIDYAFEGNTSRWDAMSKIATAFNYELYFDAMGYLVMRQFQDPINAPLSFTFDTGPLGSLVTYTKSVNDTRIYNHIVVTGESSDSDTIPVSAEALNTEPSSSTNIATLGDRTWQYSSAFITTTQQAQDLAKSYLKIMSLEEFNLDFSSIALPWLEVGEIIEFIDPRKNAGAPTRFLLSSLNMPLGLGAMSGNAKRVTVVG